MNLFRGLSWWHTCHSRKKSNSVGCQRWRFRQSFLPKYYLDYRKLFDKNPTMVSMTTTIPILGGSVGGLQRGNALPNVTLKISLYVSMDKFESVVSTL